jgi:hypothetical protein
MKKHIEELNEIRTEISKMSVSLKNIIIELNQIDYHLNKLNLDNNLKINLNE